MQEQQMGTFRLGDRVVHPDLHRIEGPDGFTEVEPKAMAVLVSLATHFGEVLSADQLIDEVWLGRPMGDNPVYRCITKLRKALGDSAQNPAYIGTVTRRGYRLLKEPEPVDGAGRAPAPAVEDREDLRKMAEARRGPTVIQGSLIVAIVAVALIGIFILPSDPIPAASIVVLSFEDLQGSGDSPDDVGIGISNRIRSQLGKIAGVQVQSQTISSPANGKTPQEYRDEFAVAHLLEGSVRVMDGQLELIWELVDTEKGIRVEGDNERVSYVRLLEAEELVAQAVLRKILTVLPVDPPASPAGTDSVEAYRLYSIGRRFLALPVSDRYLDDAETSFNDAKKADPDYARAYAGLCDVHKRKFQRSGNAAHFDEAKKNCDRAQDIDPGLSDTFLALGQLYRASGQYGQAAANFENALAINPTQLDALSGLAAALGELGRRVEADAAFERLLLRFPKSPAAHARYGVYLFRTGHYAEALRSYERALELGQSTPSIYNSIATCHFQLGDIELAMANYRDSLRLKETPRAHTNLGSMYFYLQRYEDAVDEYRAALEFPNGATDYRLWANLAAGLRQLPGQEVDLRNACTEAVRLGDEVLVESPDNAAVLSYIASCRAIVADADQARADAIRAAELAPDRHIVLYYSAVALTTTGDYEAAVRLIEQAMEHGYLPQHVKIDPELAPILDYIDFPETTVSD